MFGIDFIELLRLFAVAHSVLIYALLFFIIFAESGLFFGFFFPGDSLLFTAGLLASQGFMNEWILIPLLAVAAILGDSTGFWTGRKFGGWMMKQKESFIFKKKHLLKAQAFYEKHGGKTLILARFMPAIRTFAPIVAGMADMKYEKFIKFNVVGGLLWSVGLSLLGFFLGNVIPENKIDHYLFPIVGTIVILSVIPAIIHMRSEQTVGEGFSLGYRIKLFFSRIVGSIVRK